MEAERLNITEEVKALMLELTELRSRADMSARSDLEIVKDRVQQLNDKLAILMHLLKHGQSHLVESEVKAFVEEGDRELESLEEESSTEIEDQEPELESEDQDELDLDDLKEQEKAMGLSSSGSIHDREEDNEDHSIAKKLELQPIEDLKKAIGLNERFHYANELFQGDGQEYARAIEEFNHLGSFDDAQRLIEAKYADNYHWDSHEEARDSFLILLRRRYLNPA